MLKLNVATHLYVFEFGVSVMTSPFSFNLLFVIIILNRKEATKSLSLKCPKQSVVASTYLSLSLLWDI